MLSAWRICCTTLSRRPPLRVTSQIAEFQAQFDAFDADRSGDISHEELKQVRRPQEPISDLQHNQRRRFAAGHKKCRTRSDRRTYYRDDQGAGAGEKLATWKPSTTGLNACTAGVRPERRRADQLCRVSCNDVAAAIRPV
jgi:hypothetical protein